MQNRRTSLKQLLILLLIGTLLWLVIPSPNGLEDQGWHLLIIFLLTVIGIIMNPLPMGAMMLLSLTTCVVTGTISLEEALSGFSSDIVWLVLVAFFIAKAVIKSSLGKRIAYFAIYKLGSSLLGLSYGLVLTEFLLAPAIPSATARSGGIIFPIAKSISDQLVSMDNINKGAQKIRAFLMQVCFQGNVITSAMFLTSMAGNPLIAKLANNLGTEITWGMWAAGAIVPGMLNLLAMPMIIYYFIRPRTQSTDHVSEMAKAALSEMGSMTRNEVIVLITFVGLISLWIFGKSFGISSTTTALLGFLLLILCDVINWEDAISEKEAWKTFVWFASFITLSKYLSVFGVTAWVGNNITSVFANHNPLVILPLFILIFFYIHYLFASITVYASVMYSTFFLMLTIAQAPHLLAALVLAFFANLSGCLTHYGISSAPIFFAESRLSIKKWWYIGFVMSVVNILFWGVIGGVWWKVLGLW